jgi:hypothetical protein
MKDLKIQINMPLKKYDEAVGYSSKDLGGQARHFAVRRL